MSGVRCNQQVTPQSQILRLLSLVVCLQLASTSASAQRAAPARAPSLLGTWRVQRGVVAPWVNDPKYHPDTREWLGKTFRIDAKRVSGVAPLDCGAAHYKATRMPPDGLFQGSLPKPQKPAAQALGFKTFPVAGTSLDCDKGVFEFHFADANAVLIAVSNVIWTLDRSPGALAAAGTPSAVVQQLLERHFAGDMGFDAKSIAAKKLYLSDGLYTRIGQYLKRPANPNEAPEIDGDPFTDSQEYPTRFSVGAATADGARMLVPVQFSDGYSSKRVTYVMEKQAAEWRVADIRAGKGERTFWELMK